MPSSVPDLFAGFEPDSQSPYDISVQKAAYLARVLQQRASVLQTPQERRQQMELDRMIHNPSDKVTLTQMTDQAFRSRNATRAVDQLVHILDVQGVPRFFNPFDRTLLRGFQSFGSYLPGVAVPLVKGKMHKETANVILPAEEEKLTPHLCQRRDEGVRMNVNYLGEALLGEKEAARRLQGYIQALQLPEMEVISVKISTIYSQISPLAREHTIGVLCDRMEALYRAASDAHFVCSDGTEVPKFVYLDMEEYRDMQITAEVFRRTLERPGLENVQGGIALQAYVPDSFLVQQELNEWARRRVADGGAPMTIRIVKGANMEMERVEASQRDWPQAPYKAKIETDANYKRMVREGMLPDNINAVRLGIASHNLFDLAYGLVLAYENQAIDRVQFEMLEGMANHQRRALFELCENLLLYAPACKHEDFIHAIGYLIRRLDENTGPDNFLRHAFKIEVGSPDWDRLEKSFLESFDHIEKAAVQPRRTQDRGEETFAGDPPKLCAWPAEPFENEPDTDFSLLANVHWAEKIVADWKDRCGEQAIAIPLVVAGEEIMNDRPVRECTDPSRPGVVVGRYRQANQQDIERTVSCAHDDPDKWRAMPPDERAMVLSRVAQELRRARGDLMGAAMGDGGKTLLESDPEVSEAVDFAEFYVRTALSFHELRNLQVAPRGVVAVVSPWNFPIAIPCGGVAAGLAAGNTVILKPASDSVLVAYELCKCFWRAGVSQRVLQFVPCSGATEGQQLVSHPDVDVVILTGGTETAMNMLEHKPDINLLAETGGKNATIVTAMADRDQAIKHLLHSAFSHSGQKCSATSLLILEEEVFEDAEFKRALCDAVESMPVGSSWKLQNRIGPLIRPPSGDLENAIEQLHPGESWAVEPRQLEDNPHLYTPAVKWNVQPGSYSHMTEFFGPVLGVMKARNLDDAIGMVNATGYGLTSGLESLDDREQQHWQQSIRAGNLYLNRVTTGAVVLRQPFGGMGKSAFGPGIKAGGPNYVAQLMDLRDVEPPSTTDHPVDERLADMYFKIEELLRNASDLPVNELRQVQQAIASYDRNMRDEFSQTHDSFRLVGQDNWRRYEPAGHMRVRVQPDDSLFEVFARVCAAKAARCRTTVSLPHDYDPPHVRLLDQLTESWAGDVEFIEEDDEELAACIRESQTDRLRYASAERVPLAIRREASKVGLFVADAPVLMEGRVELLWYVREQSLCVDYHRYGNLGARASEERTEPL